MGRARPLAPSVVRLTLGSVIIGVSLFQIYTFEYDLAQSTSREMIRREVKLATVHVERAPVPFLPRIVKRRPLPPLTSLFHYNISTGEAKILGNVTDLLDFAIIGFSKCGTSTMMEYLNQPPLAAVIQKERCDVGYNLPARLVPALRRVARQNDGGDTLIGIKCPRNLDDEMKHYSTLFPKTKFIVGLRHPVHWFQSLYNFRVNNEGPLPHPNALLGSHIKGARAVFGDRARYHFYLARLGKTPLKDDKELSMLFSKGKRRERTQFFRNFLIENVGHKVFLYHVEQLSNDADSESFVTDLTNFLGLNQTLHPVVHRKIPGKKFSDEETQAKREALKINICDAEYKPLRDVLVEHGRTAAQWIREYFLQSPDVMVPSGKSFDWLMDQWAYDPCDNNLIYKH